MSWFSEPRYRVWHVESTDSRSSVGTVVTLRDLGLESDEALDKIVRDLSGQYGTDPAEGCFGPVIREFPGVRTRYTRLAWERLTTWGRVSDVILVSEIPED